MRTRYGLNVGEVIVGNFGSADRMNGTALGAAVNLASRLEGLNTRYGTDVLVTDTIAARCRERFAFRRIDRVQPKGLSQPVTVVTLVGPKADPADAERLKLWADILDAYDKQDWSGALQRLAAYRAADPDDPVTAIYLERCRRFLEAPPLESWDAVAV